MRWVIMPAELNAADATQWLTIVGIGEDGVAGLGDEAKRAISAASRIVFGGKRHLALAAELIRGEARAWPTPFDAEMRDVVALRGQKVCVLASGDPFLHGVGVTLARASAASRNARAAGAVRLLARRLPPRLGAAGRRDGFAAWPRRSS